MFGFELGKLSESLFLAGLLALVLTLLLYRLLSKLQGFLSRRIMLRESSSLYHGVLSALVVRTHHLVLLALALFIASLAIPLPAAFDRPVQVLFTIALAFQIGSWGSHLIEFFSARHFRTAGEDVPRSSALALVTFGGHAILWTLVLLLLLDNLGINVTALIAGLGIGGVAVALAVQNVLGDLLASLSIVLDKPFEVGDFIAVGEFMGTVEKIGIKTTRLRSLTGEQLVISNSDLLSSRTRNYKRMQERRVLFRVQVMYETPHEKVQRIPEMIRQIVADHQKVRFDRAHFQGYSDFGLIFEIVYFVLDSQFNTYMDIQQSINLKLFEQFEKEQIRFAYPTQRIVLDRGQEIPGAEELGEPAEEQEPRAMLADRRLG